MGLDWQTIWHKTAYIIVHHTTIWLLAVYFGTAAAAWLLAADLEKKQDRVREAKLARKTTYVYVSMGIFLWAFSTVMS